MFVWIRSATRRASPMKFFWNSGMAEYSLRMSFTATVFLNWPAPCWWASYTTPIPPSAIVRTIS